MPLPRPDLGLVVQYGFVWSSADRGAPPDAGKYRPCLIVDIVEVDDIPGRRTLRVTYLPISHMGPRRGERALPIGARIARHLGLSSEQSYLYVSYACEDDWPFDLAHVPGKEGKFHYGFIPRALFQAIAEEFARYLATRPQTVHKREA